MTFCSVRIGMVDPEYAVEAEIVGMGGEQPHEWSPYPDDDGVALLLHWRQPATGAVLPIVIAAPVNTAAAIAMCGVEIGDTLLVQGPSEQLFWPSVLGEIVVMRCPHSIEVVRRADQASHQKSTSARRSAA